MPEYKFYWLIVVILMVSCKQPSKEERESDFKIDQPEKISSIEIYIRGELDQTLKKNGSDWVLNQKYKVRPDAIENILRILPSIQVLFYPPASAWGNMMNAIRDEGVRVVFKDKSDKSIKSYSLGGMTNDERGTYAILEGSSKPYVIHVPGFQGSLASRFNLSDNDWRDRMIFKENKADLQKVSIHYPDEPKMGFVLNKTDGQWSLSDHNNHEIKTSPSVIESYLDGFKSVGVEAIVNDYRYIPQVLESKPHAILELQMVNDSTRRVLFFPVIVEDQAQVDRFYVYDGNDFFLAQLRILQRIFRSINSF